MEKLKLQIRVAIVLGIMSLLSGLLATLALNDIFHAEADVTLEWNIVRICAGLFTAFVGSSLFTFIRVLKMIR